ncbi:hypothetical protein [Sphingomonas sp. Sphisp66]|uniref:hypothetical protein n=2 Tax=unclassified Sphingomonas TaxID=196159 RepID=UPI0039B3C45C
MSGDRYLPPPPVATSRRASAAAPSQAMAGSFWGGDGAQQPAQQDELTAPGTSTGSSGGKAPPATETIGRRAGALSDELNFPDFVASLIHGTWDAMVDSSIRQMDSYADLVAAISKPLSQFRDENVTANQARDWLMAQYPGDIGLARGESEGTLVPRGGGGDDSGESNSPTWLSDYGLGGQELTPELIEEQLVPAARDRLAGDRMQTLATLVMMGMNRIVVKDGSITARLRFRAAAADKTAIDYAVSDDPGNATPSGSWSTRGSTSYQAPVTKVSTVGVNAQTDSQLNAELFGEVKINFASETLPLDRFVDDARRMLLERAARPAQLPGKAPAAAALPAPPAPAPAAPATPAPLPATPPGGPA